MFYFLKNSSLQKENSVIYSPSSCLYQFLSSAKHKGI